jgi:hypothetical protein
LPWSILDPQISFSPTEQNTMHRRDLLRWVAAASASAGIVSASARMPLSARENNATANRSDPMINVNELVVNYLAAWNERDAKRRRELVAKTWIDGGIYIDAHRHGVGHDDIDAMINMAQTQFPGYKLRLVSKIEAHNGYVRFSWAAGGADQAPLYLAGTDFGATTDDGRFKSVTGFVDAAPAPLIKE